MTAAMRLAECRRHCSNAVTAILAAELAGTVAVNSVCPDWVKTDMGGASATRDVAEGADIAVWLALDAPVPDRQTRPQGRHRTLRAIV